MVGLGRLELPTSRLSAERSSQLSYGRGGVRNTQHTIGTVKFPEISAARRNKREKCAYSTRKTLAGNPGLLIPRKEVIQPQVPLRLPCYDLVPITELAFGAALPKVRQSDFERSPLSWLDGRCVQGSGTYSPRHG